MTQRVSESFPNFPGGFFIEDDIANYSSSITPSNVCDFDSFRRYIDVNFSYESLLKTFLSVLNCIPPESRKQLKG